MVPKVDVRSNMSSYKKYGKLILKAFPAFYIFVSIFDMIKRNQKQFANFLFLSSIPFIFLFLSINVLVLGWSFLTWNTPQHLYFPFVNEDLAILDRFALLAGFCIAFSSSLRE